MLFAYFCNFHFLLRIKKTACIVYYTNLYAVFYSFMQKGLNCILASFINPIIQYTTVTKGERGGALFPTLPVTVRKWVMWYNFHCYHPK